MRLWSPKEIPRKSVSRYIPSILSTNPHGKLPILRMEKVVYRDDRWPVQGHKDIRWQLRARSDWTQSLCYIDKLRYLLGGVLSVEGFDPK